MQFLLEQSKQRERDRRKVISGASRLRGQQRQAQRMGLTRTEYLAWRSEKDERRAQRAEDAYCRLEARAKWDECWKERYAESQDRHREQVLAKYHADPDNWSTRKKRRRLFERDGWRCRHCGRCVSDQVPMGSDDRAVAGHIVAKAVGGDWSNENMATLCHPCNVADGVNRIPIQMHIA